MYKKLSRYVLLIIITLQCVFMLVWCAQKEGMFVDELYSYGLSNGYYTPFLNAVEGYMSNWHDSSFFRDYLTVQKGERNDYASVIYNQSQDVHPPLYYMILHTVCALFPDTFTKWFGLGINIVFFALTEIVIYYIGMLLFEQDRKKAVVAVIFYGFSMAAVNTVIFIRMYMLLTFWCTLFLYLHLRLLQLMRSEKKKEQRIITGLIFAVTVLGTLTQYYFVIYAFFCCAGYGLYLLFRRKWFSFVKYAMVMLAGLLAAYLLFPSMYDHIFGSYRGTEALDYFTCDNDWDKFKCFLEFVNNQIFAGWMIPILATVVVLIVVGKIIKIIKHCSANMLPWNMLWIIILTILGDFAVITKITPFWQCRYIMSMYPLAAIAVVFLMTEAVGAFIGNANVQVLVAAVISLTLAIRANVTETPEFLYPDFDNVIEMVQSYGSMNCIYINLGDYKIMAEVDLFMNMNEVYTYYYNGEFVDTVPDVAYDHLNENGQIFLFVDIDCNPSDIVERISNMETVDSVDQLYIDEWNNLWKYGSLYLVQFK